MLPLLKCGHILHMHAAGSSLRTIAKEVGCHRNTAKRVIATQKTYEKCSQAKDAARSERAVPAKVQARRAVVAELAKMTKVINGRKLPLYASARQVADALKRRGFRAGKSTVHADLKAVARLRVRPKRPFDCTKSKLLREELRDRYRDIDPKLFIFSDEHFITTNDHTTRTMWCVKGAEGEADEAVVPRITKSRFNIPSVMIWAAMGYNYRTPLVFIEKKENADGEIKLGMNAQRYIRCCLSKLFARATAAPEGRIFMQDGARSHVAKKSLAYLERKGQRVLEAWPPYSPDLNPIELLWAELDRRISARVPTTLAELKRIAQEEWMAIPNDVMNAYVLTFQKRIRAIPDAVNA